MSFPEARGGGERLIAGSPIGPEPELENREPAHLLFPVAED